MSNTLSASVATIWFLKGRPQRTRVLLSGALCSIIGLAVIYGIKLLTSAESLESLAAGALLPPHPARAKHRHIAAATPKTANNLFFIVPPIVSIYLLAFV